MTSTYDNNQFGSYYFKIVRTERSKTYLYPLHISIQEFFRVIKLHIMDDFGYNSIHDFELVKAGQEIPGYPFAEDVPAINIASLTGSLYMNFTECESFYIRPIDPNVTEQNVTITSLSPATAQHTIVEHTTAEHTIVEHTIVEHTTAQHTTALQPE